MVQPDGTNAEIAERLHLSIRTVETHRAYIQQKLRLSTRAASRLRYRARADQRQQLDKHLTRLWAGACGTRGHPWSVVG
jgi:Bacterial regulatory proteins, luxR family